MFNLMSNFSGAHQKKPPLFLGNVPIQGALHIFYIIYPTHIIYNVNKALETVFSAISIAIFMIFHD